MSILRVANIQFNAAGTKRIDYDTTADDGIIRVTADAIKIPVGDTASRPNSQAGMIRYNSDTGYVEFGGSGNWLPVASNAAFNIANLAYTMANVAYNAQNVDYTLSNTAFGVANASFAKANTALQNTTGTFDGSLNVTGNVAIGTVNPYSTLEITPAAVGWGEGIVINPSSSGYSGIFFRKTGTSGSNTMNTWSIGKSTSTPERLQVLVNGLTGAQGVDRGDAIQQWKANGNTIFGFNVGIKTDPICPLQISGPTGDALPILRIDASSNTSSPFQWISSSLASSIGSGQNYVHLFGKAWSTPNSGYIGYKHSADGSLSNSVTIGLYGADNLLNVYAGGRVTTPLQPRFCVRTNVLYNAPASTTEMVHTSVVHNIGSHYSTTTGRFTVPIAGYYRIWTCFHSVHTTSGRHYIAVNGGQVTGAGGGVTSTSGDWRQTNLEYQVLLSAGDYISTFVSAGCYVHGDIYWGNWGAELIG